VRAISSPSFDLSFSDKYPPIFVLIKSPTPAAYAHSEGKKKGPKTCIESYSIMMYNTNQKKDGEMRRDWDLVPCSLSLLLK